MIISKTNKKTHASL